MITALVLTMCIGGVAHEAAAQEKKAIKGFSGGMMVHSGYLSGCDNPYNYDAKGPTFGIGGVAKLHLTDHFRAGFEGYFSTMPLRKKHCLRQPQQGFLERCALRLVLEDRKDISIHRHDCRRRYGDCILHVRG